MNRNSSAILALCSHLCMGENIVPLEPKEWSEIAKKLMERDMQPAELFDFSSSDLTQNLDISQDYADRLVRLMDRSASLAFEISRYENMGITPVTRADKAYPATLKKRLGNSCPPIFYCCGDMSLLTVECVGYAGSRTVSEDDEEFTKSTVKKTAAHGYGVVSGGAKGIDTFAEEAVLAAGMTAVEFLSDSMLRRLHKSSTVKAVNDGRLLLLSVAKPDAGFNVGIAMMRNRYIYAHSIGTVIVRSDLGKGGTWAGAVENLKHGWCKELCWNNQDYKGNMSLIEKGAIPVDSDWDGNIDAAVPKSAVSDQQQLSLFDD